jgi:hypothetical protein
MAYSKPANPITGTGVKKLQRSCTPIIFIGIYYDSTHLCNIRPENGHVVAKFAGTTCVPMLIKYHLQTMSTVLGAQHIIFDNILVAPH